MNLGKGRLGTGLLVLVAGVGLGACAPVQVYEGQALPDSQTALIFGTSVINDRHVTVYRLDGKNTSWFPLDLRVLPGRHTLRVAIERSHFFWVHRCYSDVEFMTEPGREYEFDIERQAGEVNVLVLIDNGVVVGKGICHEGTDKVTPRGERPRSGKGHPSGRIIDHH